MLQSLQSFGQEQLEKYNHHHHRNKGTSNQSSSGAAPRSAHGKKRDRPDKQGGANIDESDANNDLNLGDEGGVVRGENGDSHVDNQGGTDGYQNAEFGADGFSDDEGNYNNNNNDDGPGDLGRKQYV
jgi:hypothetical protein